MNVENLYISLCKSRIVEELNLQNDALVQRDYEYLHKVIFEKSGIDLSTATLRRIWSDEHEGIPQAKTLDAMAQVLGYDGWHEFKKSNPIRQRSKNKILAKTASQLLIIVVIVLGGITIWRYWYSTDEFTVSLTPEKTQHEGVPATIGFNYDVSQVENQEVKIQLSWNPFEQVVLDPSKNFYTGTYFYPDYHEAKLLLEDEILASSYVHVTTPGWHGLIMRSGFDSNPIYVDQQDFLLGNRLIISEDLSGKYGLEQLDEMFSVFTFSNEAISQVSGDNFELKTSIKGLGYLKNRICSQTDIVIKGAANSIRIPISSKGCYGITALRCSDTMLSGKTNDLSLLSTDLLQNQMIRIKIRDNELSITVGENDPFRVTYDEPIGQLKVIKLIFIGYGEMGEFKLTYQDEALKHDALAPF